MDAKTKRDRILFADGRRGFQTRFRENDDWKLTEILITTQADGTPCRECYARTGDLFARVHSFADLGNITWEIVAD